MQEKLKLIGRIKDIFERRQNIMQYLRTLEDKDYNSIEDILISYDFQAGSYTKRYFENRLLFDNYAHGIADVLNGLGTFRSILEAGIGEATTLAPMASALKERPEQLYGFDLSWSRVKCAKALLEQFHIEPTLLFTADLFAMPVRDQSVDVVLTSHAIEPNGGREREALEELYRIARRYLVLLEPGYEFATEKARARMRRHGYVTDLYASAKSLGYKIIEHRMFEVSKNPLNPTALLIIEKDGTGSADAPICCPVTKTPLALKNHAYYSEEAMLAYPILDGIPCLLPQNAILATKF